MDHGFCLLYSVNEARMCHLVLLWVLVFPLYLHWQTYSVVECSVVTLRYVRICVFLGFWVTCVLILVFSGKLLFSLCSLINTYQCFGGACYLHHLPWRWNQHVFPKCWYLHFYQIIQYYAPEDGCCDTTMKTWYLPYLYVIASKCSWNHFISEKCKTV